MRTNATLWKLLTFLTLVLCLTACKEDDSNADEQAPPSVPVSNDDWQNVSASGGTIEKGDIALTFPAGTFDNDTVVAITEVKKGYMGGNYEVSPFYQLTLPDSSNKPFTVKIKAENTNGDADFLVFAPSYSVSLKSESTEGIIVEATYNNGEYTATIPTFSRGDRKSKGVITVGLCQLKDGGANARTTTRVNDELVGKMGNVKWDLKIDYWSKYSLDYRKLTDALPDINLYIAEAIKTIHDLGFKLPDGITIHYYFKDMSNFGAFRRNFLFIRKYDKIDLQDKLVLENKTSILKQTIIHETLHYFQSYYLPTFYAHPTYEHNTMYEMGAIWIEKFANNSQPNGDYQLKHGGITNTLSKNFRIGLSRNSDDNLAIFSAYDEMGYALGPLLHYMISKNYSRGYKDNAIISLYDIFWGKMYHDSNYVLFDAMDDWYRTTFKENFFSNTDQMNNYYLALWKGEVMSDFTTTAVALIEGSSILNENNRLVALNGKVYPYGCEGLIFNLKKKFLEDSKMSDKKVVIKQEADDLKTYILYPNNGGSITQYPKVAEKGDSVEFTVDQLKSMLQTNVVDHDIFLLTVRKKGSSADKGTIPSKTSVELQDAVENKKPHVEPTSLKFPAEGGTQNVKIVLGKYTRAGYSISNEGNGWVTVSFTSSSHGMDITVTENKTGKPRSCIVNCHMTSSKADQPSSSEYETFPITVTQEAGEMEPGVIIMDAVNKCELTANAQMKNRKKNTTSQKQYKQTFDKNITFSQDGSTVHVQASYSYKEGQYDNYQSVLSFDIVNFEDNFTTSKLENVTYQYVYSNNYVDWTQPGVYGKGDEVKLEVSNVPWQRGVSKYIDGGSSHFVFSGSVSNGIYFQSLTEKQVNLTDEEITENFDYVDNKNNTFMLIVDFKANGTATSRLAAPWQSPAVETPATETIIWQ